MAKQKTEGYKRILVYEDMKAFNAPLEAINKICSLGNDVAKNYEELNLGQFTSEVFDDLTENGTLNVRIAYLDNIRAEIKRLSINNPSMQHAFLGDIDRALAPFKNSLEILKNFSSERMGYYSLQQQYRKASFIDGRFVLTEEDLEKLKDERCRIYIEDELQQSAFESLGKLVDAYNALIENLRPMNEGIAQKFSQSTIRLEDYIALQDGKASLYKPALNFFLITT